MDLGLASRCLSVAPLRSRVAGAFADGIEAGDGVGFGATTGSVGADCTGCLGVRVVVDDDFAPPRLVCFFGFVVALADVDSGVASVTFDGVNGGNDRPSSRSLKSSGVGTITGAGTSVATGSLAIIGSTVVASEGATFTATVASLTSSLVAGVLAFGVLACAIR